jgi:hypothetical protein
MKTKTIILGIVAFMMLACSLYADDSLDLRLRLKQGQVFRYGTDMAMGMESGVAGKKMKMEFSIYTATSSSVLDVDKDGNFQIQTTTDDCKWKGNSTFLKGRGSKAEETRIIFDKLCAIIKESTSVVTVDPTGNIMDFSDVSGTEEKIKTLFPAQYMFGKPKSVKEQIQAMFGERPGNKIKVGETWRVEKGDPFPLVWTFKVEKIEKGQIFITGITGQKTNDYPGTKEDMTNPFSKLFKSVKMTADMRLDAATGMAITTEAKMRFAFTMNISTSGGEGVDKNVNRAGDASLVSTMVASTRLLH